MKNSGFFLTTIVFKWKMNFSAVLNIFTLQEDELWRSENELYF